MYWVDRERKEGFPAKGNDQESDLSVDKATGAVWIGAVGRREGLDNQQSLK